MKPNPKKVFVEALENQLDLLKSRLQKPDAAHWRQIGKLAQEFTVWLERARPLISCASALIALRVEQVIGEADINGRNEKTLWKLSGLLNEAGRQLAKPGSAIQVIDLERGGKTTDDSGSKSCYATGKVALPSILVAIPDLLHPKGNPPVQFRYLIPN